MMEMDHQGKVFVGGIPWDTNEDRLREYFEVYGAVAEAVIMKDRATGRARGFGFVIFADPAVAESVIKEKHMIDGRTVEAKKAVPRDDHHLINRSIGSNQGSPGPARTRKIFVGGLPSTITESDFKRYFDQFGTVMDVVVMYDHNTKRPRGFGFITYDSEEAVNRALHKTFHELNSKMVEVKRAVPKELSLGPSQGPLLGYNYLLNRANGFLNDYVPGYNLNPIGAYGARIDGRYSPLGSGRTSFSHLGSPYVNIEPSLNGGFGGGSNPSGYGRILNPSLESNQGRYNAPIGYSANSGRDDFFLSSPSRDMWGNDALTSPSNNANRGSYFGSGTSGFGALGSNRMNWGTSHFTVALGGNSSGYGGGENSHVPRAGGFARNGGTGVSTLSSFAASRNDYEGLYRDHYHTGTVYGGSAWHTASPDPFSYGLGRSDNIGAKDPEDYGVSYDVPNRQSGRGIAA